MRESSPTGLRICCLLPQSPNMLTVTAMFRSAFRLTSLALLPLCLLLFSCSTQQSPHLAVPAGKQGLVHGGQQPVTGATIQLYAVGTGADGSASTPLLSPAVVTDANGGFNLHNAYACPSPSSLVYIVATGGNPGLFPGTNNAAISMMAALGPCGNLTSSTFIFIDELTTVAAVYSLAPFMASPSAIGSASTDATSLADAFTLASELVNTTTGTTPGTGVPPGTTVPVTQINTIADIIAACVNSPGGVAGDNSACGNLFSLTTPPGLIPATNTITALLHLANDPAMNTPSLYGLVTPTSPYQPVQPQAPPDLSISLTVSSSGFTLSTTVLNFPATRLYTTSTPLSVTLTNNTAEPVGINIDGLTASFSGANPADFTAEGGCSTPVMPGRSCNLEFTFTPSVIGTRSAYLILINTSANLEIPILMTGAGLEASGGPTELTSSVLTFTAAGTPSTTILSNPGTAAVAIDSITISNDPTSGQPVFTQTNNCGASLAPQSSCTITVTALSTTQVYSTGLLTIGDDSVSGPQTTVLTYSNSFNLLLANFAARSIGTVGETSLANIQPPGIPNGTYTITLTGPNATDFSFLAGSSSLSTTCNLSRSEPSCSPNLYFTPSALGLRVAEININGTFYGGVTGIGLAPGAQLLVTPGSVIDFGSVFVGQKSSSILITFYSVGSTAPWNQPVLTGPNASDFNLIDQSVTCTTITPTQPCPVTVTVSPTQSGERYASLLLTNFAGPQRTISLSVLGVNPP
jgi:hypothetical protein